MSSGGIFEVDEKQVELAKLDEKMSSPTFWDDPGQARIVIEKASKLKAGTEPWEGLSGRVDNLVELAELLAEEDGGDPELQSELDQEGVGISLPGLGEGSREHQGTWTRLAQQFGWGTVDDPHIASVAYADDVILLCPSMAAARRALEVLERWGKVSGLRVNPAKSTLYLAGCPEEPLEFVGRSIRRVKTLQWLGQVVAWQRGGGGRFSCP